PKALNIQNGDAKMVKNAGAIIRKSYDGIIKSILVAVYNLQAEEVVVIGHHDCGMSCVDTHALKDKMKVACIHDETFTSLDYTGVHFQQDLYGCETVEDTIAQSVGIIRNHPLLPSDIHVNGLVISLETGKADVVSLDKSEVEK